MADVQVRDVRAAFKRARLAAIACGFDRAERWQLQEGSRTNGRAWRLFSIGPSDSAGAPLPGFDGFGYLGWTRREAHCALVALAQGLEAVCLLRDGAE